MPHLDWSTQIICFRAFDGPLAWEEASPLSTFHKPSTHHPNKKSHFSLLLTLSASAPAPSQALHSTPQFIPSLTTALACPHPPLRKAAAGLLGCVLFDGAGFASSGSAAAAVDSQRYMIVDGWRQVLLSLGSPTLRHLLEAAQDAASGERAQAAC